MSKLSQYQVLLSAYPGKVRSEDGHRVLVETIRGYDTPTDLEPFADRLATVISNLDTEFYTYTTEANSRQEAAHEQNTDDEPDKFTSDDLPATFRQYAEREKRKDDTSTENDDSDEPLRSYDFSRSDIELAELTRNSKVVNVPFPRVYRCTDTSCGHFRIAKPKAVQQSVNCPDVASHQMRRFPYLFVCPRCAHIEQASPHTWMQISSDKPAPQVVIGKDDMRDSISCPENGCRGHLHVELGDRLSGVRFVCSERRDHSARFHGHCPICHKPAANGQEELLAEMRPKAVDAKHIEPLILEDIVSRHGTRLDALYETSIENEADDDTYHWNLDTITSGSQAIFHDTFGLNDVFTVADVSSVSSVYGYKSNVESHGTDLDIQGRLARTFNSNKPDYERIAYLTRREGRGIVFDLRSDVLAGIVSSGEAGYGEIASRELARLNNLDADEIAEGGTGLKLIPLLHAFQHALYQAAVEESGLEDFLAAKVLVEPGAIVLVEQRDVGAGGLSQITMNKTGNVLLRTLQRAEEILVDCARDCTDACLSCVFTDDARCHPFVSEEVEGYIPANSLLNRNLAAQVIRRA
ncbi:hypothetical protein [Haloprofundus salilacus]|uniref:hypothetical protein n=1 Tax=Haloprofundus salilacus TaxID=2876190 RepID=UPI001CCB90F1|nr:hypothetical protein [Haloprofundus salilacus]